MCFHLYLVSLLEYSISYSVSRPPSPNSLPPFFSFSDVIVSCSVDAAAAQLKAECTDPKRILWVGRLLRIIRSKQKARLLH